MRKIQGFTLLEILIALTVFAILATFTSSALYYAFNTRARLSMQAERLIHLQLAITLIERDIEQVAARAVRGNNMQLFPAFIGKANYVELTRDGLPNPHYQENRSTLKRIALLCKNNRLIRRTWNSLDTPNRQNFADKILLDQVNYCRFAYLNNRLELLPEWREYFTSPQQKIEPFPRAVQLSLTLANWGKASFLFILPEALYGGE